MPHHQQPAPESPHPDTLTPDEPDRLFRNIRVPVEHVLTERDVGPEDGEGEHHLADILHVFIGDGSGQPAVGLQPDHDQSQQRMKREYTASEDVDPEDGTEPVRIEAHQQIVSCEGDTQCKESHSQGTDPAQSTAALHITVSVLGHRRTVVTPGKHYPDEEVHAHADQEPVVIQIR